MKYIYYKYIHKYIKKAKPILTLKASDEINENIENHAPKYHDDKIMAQYNFMMIEC